jgi:hypothetical protein
MRASERKSPSTAMREATSYHSRLLAINRHFTNAADSQLISESRSVHDTLACRFIIRGEMRLIWRKYDSKFDFVMTLVGLEFFLGGVYGIALLSRSLRHPLVWIVAAIPLSFAVMGLLILVREYQLWQER